MRPVPPGLAGHLAEPATTLCRCWRFRRRDGYVLGFTDHDRDLAFDGTTFAAGSGLEAAEATAELGFAVGGGDVSGALVSSALTEADILAGRYDDAEVETWLVNWSEPTQRIRLDTASVGEIRRADGAFVAELRGIMHRLDEERGLVYRAACSADLGDGRCKVDVDDPAFAATATVLSAADGLLVVTTGLGAYAENWFAGGRLVWIDGDNAGIGVELKAHRVLAGRAELDLWQRMPGPIAVGDAFRVTAGCDKRLAMCRAKFANVENFRGFPRMPGNDFILKVATSGAEIFDGGSLFR